MPPIIVAVMATLATYAGAAAAVSLGIATAVTSLSAIVMGAVIGTITATGLGMAFQAMSSSGKPKSTEQIADVKRLIRGAITPHRVIYGDTKVSGPIIYAATSGFHDSILHLVVPLAGHAVQSIDTVWIGEEQIQVSDLVTGGVVTGTYASRAVFAFYDGTQTTADAGLIANSPDGWDASHVLTGVAYMYVQLVYDKNLFNGIPNLAAYVRGKRDIYDPRTDTLGYTTNWALVCLDYLRSDFGLACADDEIDFPSFIAAANLSDESVPLDAGGTVAQSRYTVNGAFSLDERPIDVMERLLAAGAGALVYVAGTYRLYGGAYDAPSATLVASDFAGPVEVQTMPPRSELFNGVRGTFIDPNRYWQASEFPPMQDATAVAADGEEIWRDIQLPFVNDSTRAQRLARQIMQRNRKPIIVKAPLRYASIQLSVWQTVAVTLADFGWTAKPFRVVAWAFNPADGSIVVTLQEEQVAAYAWLYDYALTVPDSPDTTLVSPFVIPAPAGLSTDEALYITRDGSGAKAMLVLRWLPAGSPFVSDYDVQYRPAGGDTWLSAAPTAGELNAQILDLAAGTYDVRVRGRSQTATGAWATMTTYVGAVMVLPPADIANLSIQSIGGLAWLRWNRVPDLDVRAGGRIEIRHTPDTSGGTWVGATSIGDAVPGDATFTVLPLKAGTYLVKAVDAGGRYSTNAASVLAEQATALAFAAQATLTEHPTFSGTKTSAVVTSSALRLSSAGQLDNAANFDAIADLDLMGGIAPSGSYVFSGGMDLGAVMNVRITSSLTAMVVNTNDTMDSRSGLLSDWLDFDGAAGGEADAWVECRYTSDDPTGTPTWSTWRRVDASEFRGRGFQFRAQLASNDPAFNIHVSALSVTAAKVA